MQLLPAQVHCHVIKVFKVILAKLPSHPSIQPTLQPIRNQTKQPNSLPTNQSINQPLINQSLHPSIHPSINKPAHNQCRLDFAWVGLGLKFHWLFKSSQIVAHKLFMARCLQSREPGVVTLGFHQLCLLQAHPFPELAMDWT